MRLLQYSSGSEFSLTRTFASDEAIPPYAILSHTWLEDGQEPAFEDIVNKTGREKLGFEKIWFCGEQATQDGLQYFWIDTCCTIQTHHRRQCTTKSAAYVAESGGTMYIAF
jgi:hypothetical protein